MRKIYALIAILSVVFLKSIAQPAGWNYTQAFTITNNTASLVTNYQAQLSVNTQALIGAGQMIATGDDIRFGKDCGGTVMYNYWIESGINTTTTSIWVKIDTLFPSGTRTFFMFYGNPAATAATSIPNVFVGPMSSTDSVSSGAAGGVGDSQRGFRFSPTEDILVTAFGKDEPTGTTRYVTLFNYATQAIISQQQVSGPAAQYSYQNITTPIWLTNGTQYLLELFQGTSDGYYFGTSSQIGQQMTYYEMDYCNSCTQNTFPTNTLPGYQYGYPDLWYWRKNNVTPAPTVSLGSGPLAVNAGPDFTFCFGNSATIGGTATGGTNSYTYNWLPSLGLSATNTATVTATPSVTTTYTETVTDGCGTVTTDQVLVTVNQLPNVIANATSTAVCTGNSVTLSGGGATSYAWSGGVMNGVSFVPVNTLTYTVTGTDANTCVNTATITVTVNPLPTVGFTVSPSSAVCAGTPVTLSGTGATSYTWTGGVTNAVAFTPVSTLTYTVTGMDANSCTNTQTATVTVNSLPTVTGTSSASNMCLTDADATLTGTPNGGTWSGPGVTGNSFDPSTAGVGNQTVTYSFTDANGCSNTATAIINVSACTGIAESLLEANGVSVYPNPNNGSFLLSVNANVGDMTIEILDAQGRVIFKSMESNVNAGFNKQISLGNIANGIYMMRLTTNGGQRIEKISVQK